MKRYAYYILPALITLGVVLEHFGVLHIGYLSITSHELKWTDLDYNYHPKEGDIFTTGELITYNNYEDGVLAFNPDYPKLLEKDVQKISDNRDRIDSIDGAEIAFYIAPFKVKVCIDEEDISINDSMLFKKIVNLEILGHYELYDTSGCDKLYERQGIKFWIRDKIVLKGLSRRTFVENKIKEIYIAQMSNKAHRIVDHFERPYIIRDQLKAIAGLQYLYGHATELDTTVVKGRSMDILRNLYRVRSYGSKTFGHRNDPEYDLRIGQAKLAEERVALPLDEDQTTTGIKDHEVKRDNL